MATGEDLVDDEAHKRSVLVRVGNFLAVEEEFVVLASHNKWCDPGLAVRI